MKSRLTLLLAGAGRTKALPQIIGINHTPAARVQQRMKRDGQVLAQVLYDTLPGATLCHLRGRLNDMLGPPPRWVVVRELFAVDSATARMLCAQHNVDPDEFVKTIPR